GRPATVSLPFAPFSCISRAFGGTICTTGSARAHRPRIARGAIRPRWTTSRLGRKTNTHDKDLTDVGF
ncbi:hypothetical protein, partial [Serratia marcescens]|uniref:hypothetical protein n=1 Tax=Serratia marcescens TaxID=615 RepID=UPI001952CDB8